MDSRPGVIDRSQSYVSRSDIVHLLHQYRPKSPSRHRSGSSSTGHGQTGSTGSSSLGGVSGATPIHTLLLQGSVFKESTKEAILEFQRLLKLFTPTLETLNGSRSNITGRIFYQSRTFRVRDPEKEHVSVEAVQPSAQPTIAASASGTSSMNTNGMNTDGSTTGTQSNLKTIVRDDHPPMLMGLRVEDDVDFDDESDDHQNTEQSDSDESSTNSESDSNDSTQNDSEGETEGDTTSDAKKRKHKRRRRQVQPEIIDLDVTPLADLLARQSSNPLVNQSPAAESEYNYYFYVRTTHNSDDDTFHREYVRLNWFRRLQWIDMSGTSISGYGVASLVASSCSNIQCLFLSECNSMDNMAVISIVNLCTQLKQLDISYCSKVNRFGLMYLSEFQLHVIQKCLEVIDVSHCGGNETRIVEEPQSGGTSPNNKLLGATSTATTATSNTNNPSSTSGALVSLALFNALEERGFRGKFIWSRQPRQEEFTGQPQVLKIPSGLPQSDPMNPFSPPIQQFTYQLTSPFLQHYQLQPHRIIDLAMRDITAQVLTEVPWKYILDQDRERIERLGKHRLQLGAQPYVSTPAGGSGSGCTIVGEGFVSDVQKEIRSRSTSAVQHAIEHGLEPPSQPPSTVNPVDGTITFDPPKYFSLNLSNQLINDRLLFYILVNWGPRLYSLTLDGTYITSHGLRELVHCTSLHILSLNSCLNLIDKSKANSILKESLRNILFLTELNLTNSRLSGRLMSSHPNLKLDTLIANGCPISSFALRMLSSSASAPTSASSSSQQGSSSGGGGTSSATEIGQNMCKYSLRFLSLSNCPFINRKSLEYIFKFPYLHFIDLSDCKGLTKDDIIDSFLTEAQTEVKYLEQVVMGKKKISSSTLASGAPISNFATMLCHLQFLLCHSIGSSFSEKRSTEFQRELNLQAARLQQLLLLQYHQAQAQMDAATAVVAAGGESSAHTQLQGNNNLIPPQPIRQVPPPVPAYLRRDFHKSPIQVCAQKSHMALRVHHAATLTRFITTGVAATGGVGVIQGGMQLLCNSTSAGGRMQQAGFSTPDPSIVSTPPPLFRGSSLLDDCPYSYLPSLPISNPQAATPITPTPPIGSRGESKMDHEGKTNHRVSPPAAGGQFTANSANLPSTLPFPLTSSNSYMMLVHDQAVGGIATGGTSLPSTVSPATGLTNHDISIGRTPIPGGPLANGGELYFAMTPDLLALTQQRSQTSITANSGNGSVSGSDRMTQEGMNHVFTGMNIGNTILPSPALVQPYSSVSYAPVSSLPVPATLSVPSIFPTTISTPGAPATPIAVPVIVSSSPSPSSNPPSYGLNSSFASIATSSVGGTTVQQTQQANPSQSFWSTLGPSLILRH